LGDQAKSALTFLEIVENSLLVGCSDWRAGPTGREAAASRTCALRHDVGHLRNTIEDEHLALYLILDESAGRTRTVGHRRRAETDHRAGN